VAKSTKKRKTKAQKVLKTSKINKGDVGVFRNPPKGSGLFDW